MWRHEHSDVLPRSRPKSTCGWFACDIPSLIDLSMKLSRHLCREFALQTLFAWLFWSKEKSLSQLFTELQAAYFEYKPSQLDFTQGILTGVEQHFQEIVAYVEKFAPEWPFEKISLVDQATLCVGVYEVMFSEEVPDVVAINEAIELAKKFGNDTSPKFVNGVLHSLMKSKA